MYTQICSDFNLISTWIFQECNFFKPWFSISVKMLHPLDGLGTCNWLIIYSKCLRFLDKGFYHCKPAAAAAAAAAAGVVVVVVVAASSFVFRTPPFVHQVVIASRGPPEFPKALVLRISIWRNICTTKCASSALLMEDSVFQSMGSFKLMLRLYILYWYMTITLAVTKTPWLWVITVNKLLMYV